MHTRTKYSQVHMQVGRISIIFVLFFLVGFHVLRTSLMAFYFITNLKANWQHSEDMVEAFQLI